MTVFERRPRRRQFLQAGVAAAGALMLPGKAPAEGGAKPLSGTILNIACFNAPYPKLMADYISQFEEATGAKVNYETPSFPIYNQRTDVELSTGGSSYDVLNVTFIYSGRWIGAGWFVSLDSFLKDPQKTPADWDAEDFLPGAAAAFKDPAGRLYAIPWTADVYMAGAGRYDLFEKAGKPMPDTFDELADAMKAVHMKDGVPAFLTENHYGWTFIPFLMGFGGAVFRNPPRSAYWSSRRRDWRHRRFGRWDGRHGAGGLSHSALARAGFPSKAKKCCGRFMTVFSPRSSADGYESGLL
jgi:multiple sugar transport system substrate-binding protein